MRNRDAHYLASLDREIGQSIVPQTAGHGTVSVSLFRVTHGGEPSTGRQRRLIVGTQNALALLVDVNEHAPSLIRHPRSLEVDAERQFGAQGVDMFVAEVAPVSSYYCLPKEAGFIKATKVLQLGRDVRPSDGGRTAVRTVDPNLSPQTLLVPFQGFFWRSEVGRLFGSLADSL